MSSPALSILSGRDRRGVVPMRSRGRCGAVLLEVVLALVLFVAAATVLSVAMSSSMEALERQKRQLHAANLSISVFSELQLGIRSLASVGPEPFKAPFTGWTWQLASSPTEDELGQGNGLTRVEVILQHLETSTTYRSCQILGAAHAPPAGANTTLQPGGSL